MLGEEHRVAVEVAGDVAAVRLDEALQIGLANRVVPSGSARAEAEELAARIVAEGLSVRGTEEAVTLLGRRTPGRSRSTPRKMSMPGVEDLAGRLSDEFDTKVRVELGRRKGKIVVEFATIDDLERLVAIIAPGVARRRGRPVPAEADTSAETGRSEGNGAAEVG